MRLDLSCIKAIKKVIDMTFIDNLYEKKITKKKGNQKLHKSFKKINN